MAFVIIAAVALAAVWVSQFADLMSLADRDFPGSYDKFIWGAAFILFPPVAPLSFLFYKGAYIASYERREGSQGHIGQG